MKPLALLLLVPCCLFASGALIVADEFPAMETLAAALRAGAKTEVAIVKQTEIPSGLARYSAVIVYIHGGLDEPAERALIDYAQGGGRLILLHHSISTGKRQNRYWFPFLGVSLPAAEFSQGGYKYYEEIGMEIVNLAPGHFITTNKVKYERAIPYRTEGERPAFELTDTEVYLNQMLEGDRTLLLGFRFHDKTSGRTYMQDGAGWYKTAGRGLVMYFMPGHGVHEFQHPAYAQILVNALLFEPK